MLADLQKTLIERKNKILFLFNTVRGYLVGTRRKCWLNW